jgi:ABC-2 type transport system permease protein
MIGALRYEWARLRTLRSTWWLLFFALLLNGLIAFAIARSTGSGDPLDTEIVTALLTGGAGVAPLAFPAVLMGVVGIFAFGHEYRHGLIRTTLSVIPRRGAVLAAKVVVTALWAALVAGLALAVAYGVGWFELRDRWTPSLLVAGQSERVLLGFVALVVLTALLGLGLAGLFRNVPAALVALLVTPLVLEPVITGLLTLNALEPARALGPYLPFSAAQRMLALSSQPLADGLHAPLSPLGGGLTFLGYVAAITALTGLLLRIRDA